MNANDARRLADLIEAIESEDYLVEDVEMDVETDAMPNNPIEAMMGGGMNQMSDETERRQMYYLKVSQDE